MLRQRRRAPHTPPCPNNIQPYTAVARPLDQLTILIVEDVEVTRKLLFAMLRQIGVGQVAWARDGEEAGRVLDRPNHGIDIVMCDWFMPKMSGLGLLIQVRKTNPDLPFIMVTSNTERQAVRAAVKQGANAFIAKPFSPAELESKIGVAARRLAA